MSFYTDAHLLMSKIDSFLIRYEFSPHYQHVPFFPPRISALWRVSLKAVVWK